MNNELTQLLLDAAEQLEVYEDRFGVGMYDNTYAPELKAAAAALEAQEPVAWLGVLRAELTEEIYGATRSAVTSKAGEAGWPSALTDVMPLYLHLHSSAVPDGFLRHARSVIGGVLASCRPKCGDENQYIGGQALDELGRIEQDISAMLSAAPQREGQTVNDIVQRLISAAEDFPEIEENPSYLYCAASVEIQHLRTRLATAEADVERLDWLDRNLQMKNGWRVGVAKAGNIVVTSVGNNSTGIRAAIDAARGGE